MLPASAAGAVKTGLDRHAGMRLTLDGRVLTAKIVNTPHIHRDPTTEERLYGKRIDAICSPRSRPQRRGLVIRRQLWPPGVRRMPFVFARDISRRVKWCLIEHHAGDLAFVSFIQRERPMFVGKGRSPSSDWWRLAGWRGLFAEPCALLQMPGWDSEECFSDFSERPVTLGAAAFGPCNRDVLVFGVVARDAATVRVSMANGSTVDARLYEPPMGSRVRARYFAVALPAGADVSRVQSFDPDGGSLARRSIEGQVGGPCP